jgi:hypothetical protein
MKMKKVVLIALGLILMGCGKKEPLTPEQQWHGYCVSIGNAARSIALDRQNGIEEKQAKEHASKIEDEMTVNLFSKLLKRFTDFQSDQLKSDPDAIREHLKKKFTDQCLVTPHDKLPNYKSF